jgi:hypothetical protein
MRDFLEQIKIGLDNDLYYLSLFAALAIPDICGAIGSDNGEADSHKYKDWFDRYVADKYRGFLTADDCYFFRCSLLHQGSTQHPKSGYSKILFVEPSATTNVFHCNIINDALNIDVRIFCNDIIEGAKVWLQQYEKTELYKKNYGKFISRYPNGLIPYIVGVPVIG